MITNAIANPSPGKWNSRLIEVFYVGVFVYLSLLNLFFYLQHLIRSVLCCTMRKGHMHTAGEYNHKNR